MVTVLHSAQSTLREYLSSTFDGGAGDGSQQQHGGAAVAASPNERVSIAKQAIQLVQREWCLRSRWALKVLGCLSHLSTQLNDVELDAVAEAGHTVTTAHGTLREYALAVASIYGKQQPQLPGVGGGCGMAQPASSTLTLFDGSTSFAADGGSFAVSTSAVATATSSQRRGGVPAFMRRKAEKSAAMSASADGGASQHTPTSQLRHLSASALEQLPGNIKAIIEEVSRLIET